MKDITIIIPLHDLSSKYVDMLRKAVENIGSITYDGNIKTMVVIPENCDSIEEIEKIKNISFIVNPGNTDYCSQINYGASKVDTEYFTIMEVDDKYNSNWFNMFNTYLNTNEDVSVFLPINVVHNIKTNDREFVNHIAWSTGFTTSDDSTDVAAMDRIGFITFNSIFNEASFNLTGGIFKTSDWLGYKPSIKVAFNYEYMLRATNPKGKNQKIYVIPKEGYYHEIYREDSLCEKYFNEISEEDTMKWFELAKREYSYNEDRNNDIISDKTEVIK